MQPDGYVKIKDRSKDIIISGGENISSVEVEDILYRHPAIMAAAVVATPDPKWGEVPCAFIELKEKMTVSAEELRDFCRERMAHFKVPKRFIFDDGAENLDRQDPEVRPARAGQGDGCDRVVAHHDKIQGDHLENTAHRLDGSHHPEHGGCTRR